MSTLVKTCDKPAIVISAFHNDAFDILKTGLNGKLLMVKKLTALIVSKHGKDMMSFAAYSNDTDALSQLIRDKGLSEHSNHFHVTYRECVTALYGAIPVSMDSDARRKYGERLTTEQKTVYDKALAAAKTESKPDAVATALAVRAVKVGKKQVKQPVAGAPKGETQNHPTSLKETVEQVIARYGMFEIIDGIVSTLNANPATKGKAKALASLRAQLAREMEPRKSA